MQSQKLKVHIRQANKAVNPTACVPTCGGCAHGARFAPAAGYGRRWAAGSCEDIMPKGDPDYWKKTHEPLNVELQSVVRGTWADQPPVSDLQLQFIPHYTGKHCLESVRLSRLA